MMEQGKSNPDLEREENLVTRIPTEGFSWQFRIASGAEHPRGKQNRSSYRNLDTLPTCAFAVR